MKKNFRFFLALWVGKFIFLGLNLFKRTGTNLPGTWALKICPDILAIIDKPKKNYCITGTNGKTTTSNMIEDIMEKLGANFLSNRLGANTKTGITSCLISYTTFGGKMKYDCGIYEIDERSAYQTVPLLKPDKMMVLNLFRDTMKRNAHTEFIYDLLDQAIPAETEVILNGDDVITCNFKKGTTPIYFSMDKLDFEPQHTFNIARDCSHCPNCASELEYDFLRYHHIGKAHCPNCDFKTPDAQYRIVHIDKERNELTALVYGKEFTMKLADTNPVNCYNQIAAIAFLNQIGVPMDKIQKSFENQKTIESRFSVRKIGDKSFIRTLAKASAVSTTRPIENFLPYPGKKCVLFTISQEGFDTSIENVSWQYDADYFRLNSDDVTQLVLWGPRHKDLRMIMLYNGIPEEKIFNVESPEEAIEVTDIVNNDIFVMIHAVHVKAHSEKILQGIEEKAKKLMEGGDNE